jgi:hypothetical protein
MDSDESVGERAANHTWSIMSAIGGAAVVFVMSHAWTCADGLRIEFDPLQSLVLASQCEAVFPGVSGNAAAPYVVSAVAAVTIGLIVEVATWLGRKRTS